MFTIRLDAVVLFICSSAVLISCATSSDRSAGQLKQENLGRGIVEGTTGYREISRDAAASVEHGRTMVGQVVTLEGGAYVIRTRDGREHRISHDQNTSIDRPAHVGDWIHVEFDEQGRARAVHHADVP